MSALRFLEEWMLRGEVLGRAGVVSPGPWVRVTKDRRGHAHCRLGLGTEVSPGSGLANIGRCPLGFSLMESATCCFESAFKIRWSEVSPAGIRGNPS